MKKVLCLTMFISLQLSLLAMEDETLTNMEESGMEYYPANPTEGAAIDQGYGN